MKLSSVCQLAPFTISRPSPSVSRSSLEMMLTSAHSGVRSSCLRSIGVPNRAKPHDPGARAMTWRDAGKALRKVAEYSVGADGPYARLHERHLCGLRRQSRRLGQPRQRGRRRASGRLPEVPAPRRHLAHPHDRAADHRQEIGDAPQAGNPYALRKVADTEHGIVVRGARILATLAPFADEIAVYPALPLQRAPTTTRSPSASPWARPAEVPAAATAPRRRPTVSTIRCRAASTSRTPS